MSWSSSDRPTGAEAVPFLPELVIDAWSSGHLRCNRLVDIAQLDTARLTGTRKTPGQARSSGVAASQLLTAGR
jgi:hypothetical protein